VQVHDARLAASMIVHGVTSIHVQCRGLQPIHWTHRFAPKQYLEDLPV
jgi:hypothetical protein